MKDLNDAKYIAGFVYTTSIVIAMTFISTVTLSHYLNIFAVIYSFGFWFVIAKITCAILYAQQILLTCILIPLLM